VNVVVLYEDARSRSSGQFRFHDLVTRSVADAKGVADADLHQFSGRCTGIPKKGADKVIASLRDAAYVSRLVDSSPAHSVVAVLDRDQVHRHLDLSPAPCTSAVTSAVHAGVARQEHVKVVLLDRNLETVVERVRACDPALVPTDEYVRAIERKDPLARDTVFQKAAARATVRAALRKAMPSFQYLVASVALRL
jgi:hypothetical protein